MDRRRRTAPDHRPCSFVGPHKAATSVLASAYFQRLAKERGLDVRVVSAGTEPDADVAPALVNHLTTNGYEIPVKKPKLVTAEEVAAADVVVSIGCDLTGLPKATGHAPGVGRTGP